MQSPSSRFRSQQFFLTDQGMQRNVLFKFIEISVGGDALLSHPDGLQHHGGRKPTETFVTDFYYKSVNFGELKKIKIILFRIYELFR